MSGRLIVNDVILLRNTNVFSLDGPFARNLGDPDVVKRRVSISTPKIEPKYFPTYIRDNRTNRVLINHDNRDNRTRIYFVIIIFS